MPILITGGAGFIGSHLADRLTADGAAVRVLDDLSSGHAENLPKGAELLVGDVADGEAVERASHGVEAIFHLAAITSSTRALTERTRTRQVNATGTARVLEAAGRQTIPVIFASSAAVYGDNTALPLTEIAIPRPLSPPMRSTSLPPNPTPRPPDGCAGCRPSVCGFSMCMGHGKIRTRRVPASSRSSPTGRRAATQWKSTATVNRHGTSSMLTMSSTLCCALGVSRDRADHRERFSMFAPGKRFRLPNSREK